MSMEKYGVQDADLRHSLADRERDLKHKIVQLRSRDHKVASDELARAEKELSEVRAKISELGG